MKNTAALSLALFLIMLGCTTSPETQITADTSMSGTRIPDQAEGTVQVVRSKITSFSEEQSERFLKQVALRQVAAERGEMLRQLLSEKVTLHNQILESLKQDYKWHPKSSYRFNEDTNTLLELPVETAEEDSESEEKVVYTFEDDSDLDRFRRLLTAKQQLEVQTASLTSMLNEQLQTLSKIRDNLKETFNVDPDEQYHYDHKEMVLYLLSNAKEE